MVLKLASLKADLAAERDGEWIELTGFTGLVDLDGVKLKVRSLLYPPFQQAFEAAQRKLSARHGNRRVPEDELAPIVGALYAEHLVLDWSGIDIPYSADVAREQLMDVANREWRAYVLAAASRVGSAKHEYIQDVEKN